MSCSFGTHKWPFVYIFVMMTIMVMTIMVSRSPCALALLAAMIDDLQHLLQRMRNQRT